eukprot:m.167289 g.167289  ORF g.167289 m.167289 type:complete len:138 (+) comp53163_c0_seq3:212-625(+)
MDHVSEGADLPSDFLPDDTAVALMLPEFMLAECLAEDDTCRPAPFLENASPVTALASPPLPSPTQQHTLPLHQQRQKSLSCPQGVPRYPIYTPSSARDAPHMIMSARTRVSNPGGDSASSPLSFVQSSTVSGQVSDG